MTAGFCFACAAGIRLADIVLRPLTVQELIMSKKYKIYINFILVFPQHPY